MEVCIVHLPPRNIHKYKRVPCTNPPGSVYLRPKAIPSLVDLCSRTIASDVLGKLHEEKLMERRLSEGTLIRSAAGRKSASALQHVDIGAALGLPRLLAVDSNMWRAPATESDADTGSNTDIESDTETSDEPVHMLTTSHPRKLTRTDYINALLLHPHLSNFSTHLPLHNRHRIREVDICPSCGHGACLPTLSIRRYRVTIAGCERALFCSEKCARRAAVKEGSLTDEKEFKVVPVDLSAEHLHRSPRWSHETNSEAR